MCLVFIVFLAVYSLFLIVSGEYFEKISSEPESVLPNLHWDMMPGDALPGVVHRSNSVDGSIYSPRTSTIEYEPSQLELEWSSQPQAGHMCALMEAQHEQVTHWLRYSSDVFHPNGKAPREPTTEESAVLSRIRPRLDDWQYIEPLTGAARHPEFRGQTSTWAGVFSRFQKGAWYEALSGLWVPSKCPGVLHDYWLEKTLKFDLSYLILMNKCGAPPSSPAGRNILLDLGCTTFGDGKRKQVSGTAPSMPMFFRMYAERCIVFDELYGWEGKKYDNWWKDIPTRSRPRIHFYNAFVQEDELHHQRKNHHTKFGSPAAPQDSFLNFLLEGNFTEEDTIVLKVDIDNGPELQIVEAIASRPDLAAIIDELFFEYHFWFDGLDFGWGEDPSPPGDGRHTIDTAIALFTKLRKAGVRAHFWI